ncbi:MAG TPA: hypothetical protein VIY73_29290 [Polyangiaceae bacterium]
MALRTASRRIGAATLLVACLAVTRPATADAAAADQAMAQSLFDEARNLMDRRDYPAACAKFAESERLDPGGGTILNLALCHEAMGKTASAWTEFNEALSRAIRDGRSEREARAKERIAVLGPRLSRLTVITAAGAPGLTVTVDGAPWGEALRGAPVPLDPGPHVVTATAAGMHPWTATIALGANADTQLVRVPPLSPSDKLEPSAAREEAVVDRTPARVGSGSTWGWAIGGAGLAALGVGSAFGVLAIVKRGDSNAECRSSCSADGVRLNDQAITDAWISDFGVGLGIVGVAAGIVLLVTSHEASPRAAVSAPLRVVPAVLARGAGAVLTVDLQ